MKFLHYNSPVFEKYYLSQTLENISAEVDYKHSAPNHINEIPYKYRSVKWGFLLGIKNKDVIFSYRAVELKLAFEINGKKYSVRKTFQQGVHYDRRDMFKKYEEQKKANFFINPNNPEKDIFIFKPRVTEEEIERLQLSIIILICALLCFSRERRIKKFAQLTCIFFIGALAYDHPHNNADGYRVNCIEYVIFYITLIAILAFKIIQIFSKLFKKFRPSEKPPA